MSVTIKDIVKDTNLSLATVSKYLNNKKISEPNRLIIEESIKRLHYIPNKSAQALRTRVSHCICIFMPDIHDYHFGYECNYIVGHLKRSNYSTIVRAYSSSPDSGNDILFLENRQIDGVILFAYATYPPALIEQLNNCQIPYICIHQKPDIPSDFIGCSNKSSGYKAAAYLYKKGHRHFAVIGLESYASRNKLKGILDFLHTHDISSSNQTIHLHTLDQPVSDNYFFELPKNGTKPSAVISLDYTTTMQVLGNYTDYVHVSSSPVSFLVFDDDDIFSAITPALTVFKKNAEEIGRQAAALILKRMQRDITSFPEEHLVDALFIERHSVFKHKNNAYSK